MAAGGLQYHAAWDYAVHLHIAVKIRAWMWQAFSHGIHYQLQASAYNGSTCAYVRCCSGTHISYAMGCIDTTGACILWNDISCGTCDEEIYASS